jgi:hypothetical protein
VDEDPGSNDPPFLKEFVVVDNFAELGLRRLKHRISDKWLIELRPDLEPWLYATANQAGLPPSKYHLPEKLTILHDHPKAHTTKVVTLVAALLAKGDQRMLKLQSWLTV